MLFRYASPVDDSIFDVLLFVHDLHHLWDYGFAGTVVDEEVVLVGAAPDDVGALGSQYAFVRLGVFKKFAVDQALAVANHPDFTAQTTEDDGRGGKAVDRVGQQATAAKPAAREYGATTGSLGKGMRHLDAEAVASRVGRHLADALRHQFHGIAAIGAEAAELPGAL